MIDIEGLKQFVEISRINRDFALFFSGREDVLSHLVDRASLAMSLLVNHGIFPSGLTTIVQGCPGIGKTSLMRRLVQICNQDFEKNRTTGTMPLPIVVKSTEATDIKSIINRGLSADSSGPEMRWATGLGQDLVEKAKSTTTLGEFLDVVAPALKGRPLFVLVDEIQNADQRNREFLNALHMGIGAWKVPVVPIYFGLSSAQSRFDGLGLTRLSDDAIINLGLLTSDDCKQSFHAMLDEYRVERTEETDNWVDVMVEDCQYFPHHLTLALRATATILLETNGTTPSNRLEDAREYARSQRKEFYQRRIADSLLTPPDVVSEVAKNFQLNPTYFGGDILSASNALIETLDTTKGISATQEVAVEMINDMIHRGLLQFDPLTSCYSIPIPSFQTWAAEEL